MFARALLIAMVLAFGVHHVGPLMALGNAGHHSAPAPAPDGGDGGHDGVADAVAGTCLAVLTLMLAIPGIRRRLARMFVLARHFPGPGWAALPRAIRGPPPAQSCAPFLRLQVLRR